MRLTTVTAFLLICSLPASSQLGDALKKLGNRGSADSSGQTASGLKQALEVGTKNAVAQTGVANGFFGNEAIKILVPEKLRPVEKGLRMVGKGPMIDQFVLSMNRAAEKATPAAGAIFKDAILKMNFDDARKILSGGDTAATEFFREHTSAQLRTAFQPPVESAMKETGVSQKYETMLGGLSSLPFGAAPKSFDLNNYVVGKTLDGLFLVLGQQEKSIRTNPAARVTPLLQKVFGNR